MAENQYQTAENPQDPSSYFVDQDKELADAQRRQKVNSILQTIKYYAIKVWPFVNRVIQTVVYFLIHLIRSFVLMAIEQIKNFQGGG